MMHFFSGFILLPIGQLKSLEKLPRFIEGPLMRNWDGEWYPGKEFGQDTVVCI